MFGSLFRNLPGVTKNLLIINALFFLALMVAESRGINLNFYLGLHYPSSQYFKPYQLATHFFMHADFFHIFFNMFALVVFGAHLERVWGPKRFLIFYFVTALGAAVLHMMVQGYEVYQMTGEIFPDVYVTDWRYISENMIEIHTDPPGYTRLGAFYLGTTVGASGAVYGLIAAFAMLFPNTQLMLLFPPIPIKAKWLALGLAAFALYQGYVNNPGDSIAHFAHLGGMLFGFILVKIWQKDSTSFY